MPVSQLTASDLRITIDPQSLGFTDTSGLVQLPLSWIGQERAQQAARFGLSMMQPDYHLFVLGEVGSGRSSLLQQVMAHAASQQPTPPDLCYLYNFEAPEKPIALHVPAGQGFLLRQLIIALTRTLPNEIAKCLDGQDCKIKCEHIEKKFKAEEIKAYNALDAFAEQRCFSIHRESSQIIFTLLDQKGEILTEEQLLKLPKKRRTEIDLSEQELHEAIILYFEKTQLIEKNKDNALETLQQQIIKPLLANALKKIKKQLSPSISKESKLNRFFEQISLDILDNLALFKLNHIEEEKQLELIEQFFSRYQINLIVDNHTLQGAPVIVEENPVFRTLFGGIEYQLENGKLRTDFMGIHAGSLHKAHGGFLMLYLDDLLVDSQIWIKLHRFLRSRQLQIEENSTAFTTNAPVSLSPEAVEINVKIILIGSREEYYLLQEEDPEFIRRFRVKVDFANQFSASQETYHATAIFIAQTCQASNLPHFSAAAVASILEASHREAEDQTRQSAIFSRIEMLVLESADFCRQRNGKLVEASDITAALEAQAYRHNYPEIRLQEAINESEISIVVHDSSVAELNALTQVDLGDYSFGTPVRTTACTYAGEDGLLNIAREVEMSGPIHDKGVLILQHYLSTLFAHIAPLALNASIVFEQEYSSIEGDSASCAELFVLLSSLSGLPLKQGIGVTGALNQHGEVLPVGGINDKIEGFFKLCQMKGLDGTQGVLIPERNIQHLMLPHSIIQAVENNQFAIYTMQDVMQGMALLTGHASGLDKVNKTGSYPKKTILGYAERTLLTYRHACQMTAQTPKTVPKRVLTHTKRKN